MGLSLSVLRKYGGVGCEWSVQSRGRKTNWGNEGKSPLTSPHRPGSGGGYTRPKEEGVVGNGGAGLCRNSGPGVPFPLSSGLGPGTLPRPGAVAAGGWDRGPGRGTTRLWSTRRSDRPSFRPYSHSSVTGRTVKTLPSGHGSGRRTSRRTS